MGPNLGHDDGRSFGQRAVQEHVSPANISQNRQIRFYAPKYLQVVV
jgi:hypothetical protein